MWQTSEEKEKRMPISLRCSSNKHRRYSFLSVFCLTTMEGKEQKFFSSFFFQIKKKTFISFEIQKRKIRRRKTTKPNNEGQKERKKNFIRTLTEQARKMNSWHCLKSTRELATDFSNKQQNEMLINIEWNPIFSCAYQQNLFRSIRLTVFEILIDRNSYWSCPMFWRVKTCRFEEKEIPFDISLAMNYANTMFNIKHCLYNFIWTFSWSRRKFSCFFRKHRNKSFFIWSIVEQSVYWHLSLT